MNLKFSLIGLNFMHLIAHFTILDGNEDGVDLVLIQPLLRSYVNLVVLLLTSIFKHNVHTKTKRFVSYQGQPQPHIHSKAKVLSPQL